MNSYQDINSKLKKNIIVSKFNFLENSSFLFEFYLELCKKLGLGDPINEQLGSIYREEIPWKQQLSWGILVSNSSLPKPTPIINKLEYEQHL